MSCSCQADNDAGPPRGYFCQGLCEHGEDGQEGEDEHGAHTACIGVHAHLLDEELGQVAPRDGEEGDDEVEHEDECLSHAGRGGVAKLGEVGWGPKEEEPPHAVGHEFANDESPGLAVFEAVEEGELDVVFACLRCCVVGGVVLV